ncbi:MAG: hypothetical protein LQ352_002108 [Teloschistes flavicans]|nr:MAG: hypothetical protein LQ352_002108 [Teloschistes flavicans]
MPPPLTKIKPLLRKMSNDQKTVDLSKSAAENGIDLGSNPSYHNRNTSNTSTATATSQQYIHPMRQTPKPYTPPLAHSFANSSESGSSNNPDSTPYAPLPSPRRRIPLHVHTASIPRNTSQTNLPGTPSSLRKQNEVPMVSTRTSFDSIFRKRSRANTNEDPVVRAAQVAILRREFDERERLKEEVRREQENKRVQKVTKKQQRRDQRRSNAASDRSQMKAAKNQWQLFVFWFKTMLLKMRKGMSSN